MGYEEALAFASGVALSAPFGSNSVHIVAGTHQVLTPQLVVLHKGYAIKESGLGANLSEFAIADEMDFN